jgi:hypothetical protein
VSDVLTASTYLTPIVDYEPAPSGAVASPAPPCPPPTREALHRKTPRPLPRAAGHPPRELPVPRAAAIFADAAVRRVLEVLDRRRAVAALRPLLAPRLFDAVVALSRTPVHETAVLRRVRVRTVEALDGDASEEPRAAEIFGTYSRGSRVCAFAGRIEVVAGRWRVVALQLG